jgi:hypothetical protein
MTYIFEDTNVSVVYFIIVIEARGNLVRFRRKIFFAVVVFCVPRSQHGPSKTYYVLHGWKLLSRRRRRFGCQPRPHLSHVILVLQEAQGAN